MIDITPRESINYNQSTMMAGDPNFRGSTSSPTHSAFAREFNEPDGEFVSMEMLNIHNLKKRNLKLLFRNDHFSFAIS